MVNLGPIVFYIVFVFADTCAARVTCLAVAGVEKVNAQNFAWQLR